jgi:hypothetical protein
MSKNIIFDYYHSYRRATQGANVDLPNPVTLRSGMSCD